ncbi:MAG: YadA-like family protein [Acidaminococcaceae bacterium]|nr:YadA-like family protein [Acidaminococcaceae bacterium]
MNKIYKLIWSKVKNCYVVASELAKSHTKSNGARSARSLTARAACGIVLGAFLAVGYSMPSASAAEIVKYDDNYNIIIGYGSAAPDGFVEGGVAVGEGSYVNRGYNNFYEDTSKQVGVYLGETEFYTYNGVWSAGYDAIAVGDDRGNGTRQIIGVAAGSADSDAVNVAQLKAAIEIKDAHNYYDGTSTSESMVGQDEPVPVPVRVKDAVNAVDKALGKVEDGNYITAYDATEGIGTFADNLKALDDAIGEKITEDGNFIKKSDTNSVNANIKALDEAIGDMSGFGNNNYAKSTINVADNIKALDEQIKTNAEDIADNKAAIDQNTSDIADNKQAIADNKAAIDQNTSDIAANTKAIGKNADEISAIKAQDGQVVPEGKTKADEFVKGQTVYDYLNSDSLSFGDNSTKIAIGKGNKATGTQSIAVGFGNKVSGNNSGAFGDPNTITGDGSYAVGNNNTIGGNNTFVLGNNVTANVDNAVVLGDKSTAEANAVSVGSKGGERQIKHVAPGTDDTDAVNVSQLKAMEQQAAGNDIMLNNRINNVDNKVNKVGAGAAALAALHPLDTDDKFSMGLGYGNYRDAHAMAMGLFYRPTEKVMFSVAGSMGNGENMINAGITFALDKGKGFGTSKAAMARKINQQENQIQALQIENAKLAERLAAIEAKLAK